MLGDTQMNGVNPLDFGAARSGPAARSADRMEYDGASGMNPLVWAANPLLDMIAQIRGMHQLADPVRLRNQLLAEINNFEQRAQSVGVSREDLIGARYCLCTVLDEVAALTPWGSRGVWAKQSLLVSFHNETWGGEKYYQLLARLAQNPERHKDLIELLYYCNALGFQGRFRVEDNGFSQLEMLKRRIATILANSKGGYETRLSPHWQGVSSTPPAWRMVPTWVVAMLCGLIAVVIYIAFLFSLDNRMNLTSRRLQALAIPDVVVKKPPQAQPVVIKNLCAQLDQIMDKSRVTVTPYEARCIVTLKGDGLFESGNAVIRPAFAGALNDVADAIGAVRDTPIEATVLGHTDNVPLSAALRLRFGDNVGLSQARAESVQKQLDERLGNSHHHTKAEGYGAGFPLGDNATAEGRSRNRRVEISISRLGGQQ
jgi:type VI secretion system protein ImpK